MNQDMSILELVRHASFVVQLVMLLLFFSAFDLLSFLIVREADFFQFIEHGHDYISSSVSMPSKPSPIRRTVPSASTRASRA